MSFTVKRHRPIPVAFVVHVMQVAGAEVLVRETIHRLGKLIDPTVFCLDAVGSIGESLLQEGVPVVCLHRKPGRDWGVSRRMADQIKARSIRVLHAHQYTPFFYAALAKPLVQNRPKLILTEHGRHYPDLVSPIRRATNRLVFNRFADEINACIGFSAKALSRIDGFSGNRIEVIENGIDLRKYDFVEDKKALRAKLGLSPSRQYIAMVARFHPVKDHVMAIRAFARVAKQNDRADLLLVGGYRSNAFPVEDYDLWFRMMDVGLVANLGDILLKYRIHSSSVSASNGLMQRAMMNRIAACFLIKQKCVNSEAEALSFITGVIYRKHITAAQLSTIARTIIKLVNNIRHNTKPEEDIANMLRHIRWDFFRNAKNAGAHRISCYRWLFLVLFVGYITYTNKFTKRS